MKHVWLSSNARGISMWQDGQATRVQTRPCMSIALPSRSNRLERNRRPSSGPAMRSPCSETCSAMNRIFSGRNECEQQGHCTCPTRMLGAVVFIGLFDSIVPHYPYSKSQSPYLFFRAQIEQINIRSTLRGCFSAWQLVNLCPALWCPNWPNAKATKRSEVLQLNAVLYLC